MPSAFHERRKMGLAEILHREPLGTGPPNECHDNGPSVCQRLLGVPSRSEVVQKRLDLDLKWPEARGSFPIVCPHVVPPCPVPLPD